MSYRIAPLDPVIRCMRSLPAAIVPPRWVERGAWSLRAAFNTEIPDAGELAVVERDRDSRVSNSASRRRPTPLSHACSLTLPSLPHGSSFSSQSPLSRFCILELAHLGSSKPNTANSQTDSLLARSPSTQRYSTLLYKVSVPPVDRHFTLLESLRCLACFSSSTRCLLHPGPAFLSPQSLIHIHARPAPVRHVSVSVSMSSCSSGLLIASLVMVVKLIMSSLPIRGLLLLSVLCRLVIMAVLLLLLLLLAKVTV